MTYMSDDGRWVWNQAAQRWEPTPQQQIVVQTPSVSVSKTRRRTSHGFHLAMTILTCGLWGLLVWLPITLWHKFGPRQRTVTRAR